MGYIWLKNHGSGNGRKSRAGAAKIRGKAWYAYMTFFLPTAAVGKVALGSESLGVGCRAGLCDPRPKASFVASVAQFTPKTVETESERLKLMFRVRARINPVLLKQYLAQIKTGF